MLATTWSPEVYTTVFEFAAEAHRDQTVPGSGLPYITHVTLVSMELIAALEAEHNSELAVSCALLHDVLEDTPVTYAELLSRFGHGVAAGVSALTKDRKLRKEMQLQDCLARIRKQPCEVWMVKMADRITNLRPPPSPWTSEKRTRYRDDAVVILDLLETASSVLAKRLRDRITAYEAYIG